MSVDILVDVPAWMAEKLESIAAICNKSVDYVAGSFFADEVVHTLGAKAEVNDSFYPTGGSHPLGT